MRIFTLSVLILAVSLAVMSCGGGNPATPSAADLTARATDSATSGRACWGIWDVTIDPATSSAEVVPLRGASFEANVVNFLQPPSAPIHLLTVAISPDSDFPTGKVHCNVSLKHPFPGTKFCGFDVMGIVMDDWTPQSLDSNPSIMYSRPPSTLLRNPDGWTRWWNQVEFTTYGKIFGYIEGAMAEKSFNSTHTLNAFKYYADGIGAEDPFDPDTSLRGFFSSDNPGINTRHYELQFPVAGGVQLKFKYAVSASWEEPLGTALPPYIADEFSLLANMPEAYWIGITDNGSTAYYLSPTVYGGDLNLLVEIRDWQFSGDPSNIHDEIAAARIESPTLFPSPINLDLAQAQAVPGNSTAVRIPVSIPGVTPDGADNQVLIVTVESAYPATYEPQIPGISGYVYPDGALAAYQVCYASIGAVGPQNQGPVADASASAPLIGDAPLEVFLDPSLSYDPDGTIVLYEWDFETNGIYDASSITPDLTPHTYGGGTHKVTLRVTDNDGATGTDQITVHAGSISGPGWPTFRHDNTRTGRSSIAGPLTKTVKFEWNEGLGQAIMSGIIIDSKGRALFRCNDGYVYCIDSDGQLAWSYYVSGGWDYGTPCIDKNGFVYVGSTGGTLSCFDSEGTFQWSKGYGYGSLDGGITVQDDGTIVFVAMSSGAGRVVKTDSLGNEIWNYSTGATTPDGPSIGDDGTIYVVTHGGQMHAIDQNGGKVWVTQLGSSQMSSTPALGPDGMFVGDWGGNVYCVRYDGSIKWTKHLSGDSISSFAAVSSDGRMYIGSRDDSLYCLDQESGGISWKYQTCGDIGTTSPVLDGAGRVYVASYCGHFYCLTVDGDLVWDYDATGEIGNSNAMYCKSPAIADDGTVIVGSNAGILFAFRDG